MSQESPNKFLDLNTIKRENEEGGIEVGVMEEKLGIKKDIPISNEPEEMIKGKDTQVSRFSEEMDNEIKDLGAAESFSKELAKAARGISEYQLPHIDSFLINLEKDNPEGFKILAEKRKKVGKLIKKIFKWERVSWRRERLKEVKENEKNRYKIMEEKTKPQEEEKKTIKMPDRYDPAA